MANCLPRLTWRYKYCIRFYQNVSMICPFIIPSRSGSTLIVSGKKAASSFVYLNPKIDYDKNLSDTKNFQKEVKLRGLRINMREMQAKWLRLKEVFTRLKNLETQRNYFYEKIAQVNEEGENITEDKEIIVAKIKKSIQGIVAQQKEAQEVFWNLQDTVLIELFQLPNRLDQSTQSHSRVLTVHGCQNSAKDLDAQSHLAIGKRLGLLEYRNPTEYYLCDDAVLFELGVLEYAANILKEARMFRIAGCDFSRSVSVEGIGLDHEDPFETFILTNEQNIAENDTNKLHLVGGASMIAIMNLFVKTLLNKNDFPVRCFSTGRQYEPYPNSSVDEGLFVACQSSIVQAFVAVTNPETFEYRHAFKELVDTTTRIYEGICDHFRIVQRSAPELHHNESMRVSFELWSPYAREYVEVGHVAAYGDYLSKRLLMSYRSSNEDYFPGIISGTIISVPRLLACMLERNPEKFEIPPSLRKTTIFNGCNNNNADSV